MKHTIYIFLLKALLCSGYSANAKLKVLTQTIKGVVSDADSKKNLANASISLQGSGYEPRVIAEIAGTSGSRFFSPFHCQKKYSSFKI